MLDVAIRTKAFRTTTGSALAVLSDLAFSVPSGGFACLVGPSGCGKTTTLRILLGLDRDYDGTVALPPGRTAAVFQEPRLLPWRTLRRNVELAVGDAETHDEIDGLFAASGLAGMEMLYPGEVSLGMARRASLVRAFAARPSFLVLDEPFASLDEATAERQRDLLLALWQARQATVLMVTHDLAEAARMADKIIVLTERPATVLKVHDIATPRDLRDAGVVAKIVAELAGRAGPAD